MQLGLSQTQESVGKREPACQAANASRGRRTDATAMIFSLESGRIGGDTLDAYES
jgi:hypothetical protein